MNSRNLKRYIDAAVRREVKRYNDTTAEEIRLLSSINSVADHMRNVGTEPTAETYVGDKILEITPKINHLLMKGENDKASSLIESQLTMVIPYGRARATNNGQASRYKTLTQLFRKLLNTVLHG